MMVPVHPETEPPALSHARLWQVALFPVVAALVLAVGLLLFGGARSDPRAIVVDAHGGFFVGGQTVELRNAPQHRRVRPPEPPETIDPNGTYVSGATYVEYTRLAQPRGRLPIVMFPGGGLSAASFQDTPDGRPGWESYFLGRGYSVYLVDYNRTGRSPWRRYPDIETEEPSFRTSQFLWETFRIGPVGSWARRKQYSDTLFPVASFDRFAAQSDARYHPTPAEEAAAIDAVIHRIGPCILLVHSASGPAGMAAAQRLPTLIRAVVAVEPSGAPPADLPVSAQSPHIFVWGDHLSPAETGPRWKQLYDSTRHYERRLSRAGLPTAWIDLPAVGVVGNTHMLMMDRNSDDVAARIVQELERLLPAGVERS